MRAYIPDFKQAFEHFCIHTGGRGVIEEVEKQLKLTAEQTFPSKASLYRYGNTSSSSIYYELACEHPRNFLRSPLLVNSAFRSIDYR